MPGEQPPDGEGWVKLNTNESPLPPSPNVIEAIKAAANETLRLYPSPTAAPARQAIARRFALDPSQVAVGTGGDELIELCFRAYAGAGDRVAYPTPTYPLLDPLCRIHEAVASTHPTELFGELPPSLGPDPAPLKFIVNPNSPTGALFDQLAIAAAVAAIEDEVHHRSLVEEIVRNRSELAAALTGLGFEVVPSATNFVFTRPPRPAAEVVAGLRERKILVRHYDREPIAGWIRITIGTREQHDELLSALKEVLA